MMNENELKKNAVKNAPLEHLSLPRIIDLHCDLLSYLADKPGRTPNDPASRCSYPQLQAGHVQLQTLAIYTATSPHSIEKGRAQIEQFLQLLKHYPEQFSLGIKSQNSTVQILPAFENASSFADETEPFLYAITRLEDYLKQIGPLFYISLTWDEENRFGGGNRSKVGLKEDGSRLLEWMSGKRIALDFSHTSDRLAEDLFNCIDKNSLDIPVIASHSNFRAISPYPRNLPDDIAKEIIHRKGLIGLNFFASFIHDTDPSAIFRHVEYALSLGGENALSFGADFFCDLDMGKFLLEKYHRSEAYYKGLDNASVYPSLLTSFAQKLKLKEEQILKIASKNALEFLKDRIL